MFKIAEVITLLTKIFVKQNKRFPKGLEGIDIRLKAKKIHDIGKANNYQGGISENQLKQFLAWEKQALVKKEVSKDILKVPEKKGEVIKVDFDPGGKQTFITKAEKKAELDKLLGPDDDVFGSPIKDWQMKKFKEPGAKDVTPKETEAQIKSRLEGMNKKTVDRIRRRRYEAALKEERRKMAEDEFYIPKILDPDDFAGGGRAGTGLNYLLGEDDQNMRVPYDKGGWTQDDFNQFLKDREGRDRKQQKKDFLDDFEDWKKWKQQERGVVDWAADGGRIGFGLGGGFNAARRAFLKIMGGTAAGVGVAKSGLLGLLKSGKPVSKVLTSVPIKSGVDGMPVWFKPLVNKVIKEGDDVTKKYTTMDREIIHAAELPGSKTKIIVEQDLTTGNVIVDIGQGKHGFADGHLGQPVRLEYKAAEDIMTGPDADDLWKVGERDPHVKTKVRDEMTFDQKKHPNKKPEEFWVEEAEFTGGHPENIKFEESSFNKFGEHGSDFSEVEKFATGKVKKVKPTKKKLQTEFESGKAEADMERWADEDFASGGRVPLAEGGGIASMLGERMGYQDGLLANIPPEYRLYAGTMLPGNQTGTIDESYFNQDFKDQVKDQVLNKMDWGMEVEGYKHPKAFPSGTVRKGQIFPKDYRTEKNPQGYVAPQYGKGRTNPTGYSSVFNTLGTYGYKYNMPNAPAFDDASIDITDRYNWNPNYGTVGDFTGYIGQGYGRDDDEDYVAGTDVDAKMLKEYVFNQIKNRKLNIGQGLELLGNYLGPRASKGEGKDIKINIPVKKKYVSPARPHGNGGGGGRRPDKPGGFTDPGKGSYGPHKADGGRVPLGGGKLAQTLIQQIIKKYKGKIDDKLLKQMLADKNPQRLAEVMATVDEGLIMQGKGMGPETIIQTIKDSWKRKKQASGGLAGLLGE